MSDYGIVHSAGCDTPTPPAHGAFAKVAWRSALPLYYEEVADGRGGTVHRCRRCGAIEATLPKFEDRITPIGIEPVSARNPPGRPRLTEAAVRADLERALREIAEEGRYPSWDALAAKHNGRTEFGLTVDALRKRRERFPGLFLDLVPDLPE